MLEDVVQLQRIGISRRTISQGRSGMGLHGVSMCLDILDLTKAV
jgi:hypothetical protein